MSDAEETAMNGDLDLTPDELEKLKKLAAESVHDNPDPSGVFHRLAESTLSIAYEADGAWRINYRLPHGAIIAIVSKYRAEFVMAQMRGIMADFAARQCRTHTAVGQGPDQV